MSDDQTTDDGAAAFVRMSGPTQTTPKHALEEDITLSDGTVVRVHGLLAVAFRKNPDVVRKEVEVIVRERAARRRPLVQELDDAG